MARSFFPREALESGRLTISLLPFRFIRFEGQELLVNEAGEFLFAPSGTTQSLVDGTIATDSERYKDLKAKHFLYDDSSSPLLDVLATKIRTKFAYLDGGTKLKGVATWTV